MPQRVKLEVELAAHRDVRRGAGKEGEATEDALVKLQECGFVVAADDGYAVNGALFEFISRAIVEGAIKVSLE